MPQFRWVDRLHIKFSLPLLILLPLLSSCTRERRLEYGLSLADTLRINIITEPPTLDWNRSTDTTSSLIQDNIMEGLIQYDLQDPDFKLLPALATEWSSNSDFTKWTFTLREGVKWNDGVEFKAQQVVDGWERLLNPKTASEYAYFLYSIKNARAYNEGSIKDFSEVGVRVDAEGRLVVELDQPKSYFPMLLTHSSTFPIRKDVIEKHGDRWTDPENIVTLGAYDLKIWDHDRAIVLERNENYYGDKAKIKNILAYMVNETSTALNLFDSGRLDSLHQLPSRELGHLKRRKEYRETGIMATYYFGFNTERPPMDDVRVRRAIVHGVDRKQVTDMLQGGQIPISNWIPPGMLGYEADVGLNFDVAEANRLLDEAGFKDRSTFPTLTLSFNTMEDHRRVAENIQAQLRRNLGISVELLNEEWKVYLRSLSTNPSHIYRLGWLADYPDPDNFMGIMTSFSDQNYTRWKNSRFDELIQQAVAEGDPAKRRVLYREAQRILTEEGAAVLPLYAQVNHLLVADRVQNYPVNRLARFIFRDVELK